MRSWNVTIGQTPEPIETCLSLAVGLLNFHGYCKWVLSQLTETRSCMTSIAAGNFKIFINSSMRSIGTRKNEG